MDKEYKRHGSDSYVATARSALDTLGLNQRQWADATPDAKEDMLKEHFRKRYDAAEEAFSALKSEQLDETKYDYKKRLSDISTNRNSDNDAGKLLRYEIQNERKKEEHLEAFGIDPKDWNHADSAGKQDMLKKAVAEHPKLMGYSDRDREDAMKQLQEGVNSQWKDELTTKNLATLGIDKELWDVANEKEKGAFITLADSPDYKTNPYSAKAQAFESLKENGFSLNDNKHELNDNNDYKEPYTIKELGSEKTSYSQEVIDAWRKEIGVLPPSSLASEQNSAPSFGRTGGSGDSGGSVNTISIEAKNTAPPSDDAEELVQDLIDRFIRAFGSANSERVGPNSYNIYCGDNNQTSLCIGLDKEFGSSWSELKYNPEDDKLQRREAAELLIAGLKVNSDGKSVVSEINASSSEMRDTIIEVSEENGCRVDPKLTVTPTPSPLNTVPQPSKDSKLDQEDYTSHSL